MVQNKSDKQANYSVLRSRLEAVMVKLQAPDCDVDEAVELYEQAAVLIKQLEDQLQTAENRVKKIKADFEIEGGSRP